MATYKGIQGYSVQKLSEDPTAADVEGQLFYNSGSGKFKISVAGAGAWASGTPLNTARQYLCGTNLGTQTAALMTGGTTTAPTELWNGSTWTEILDPGTPRSKASGMGITTAFLLAGGDVVTGSPGAINKTETWDGTSWTEVNPLTDTRYNMGEFGSSTSATVAGGQSPGATNAAESWDGTSWAAIPTLNAPAFENAGAGLVSTAGIVFGGRTNSATTESWNGSTWTEVNDLNSGRQDLAGSGSSTAALSYGGYHSPTPPLALTTATEKWDGTSWTTVASLANGQWATEGVGASTAAMLCGGSAISPTTSKLVEEWNDPVYTIKTVTVS